MNAPTHSASVTLEECAALDEPAVRGKLAVRAIELLTAERRLGPAGCVARLVLTAGRVSVSAVRTNSTSSVRDQVVRAAGPMN